MNAVEQLMERVNTPREFSNDLTWDEREEDTLVGTFVGYKEVETKRGPVNLAIVDDQEGARRSVWLTRTVLCNEFRDANPQPGELFAIKYFGMQQSKKSGNSFHNYRVEVNR